jgi:hypothetical protein
MPAGEVAERSNAAVLKTVEAQVSVGSNPTLSAIQRNDQRNEDELREGQW